MGILTCLAVAVFCSQLPDYRPALVRQEESVLSARSGNVTASMVIKHLPLSKREASSWWGGYPNPESGLTPVVWGLDCKANKKKVRIWRSAFSDLAQVSNLVILLKRVGYQIRIIGGDGAEGYVATIEIRNGQCVSRTVKSSLAPDSWSEATSYKSEAADFGPQ